jgi:hypothetical protein
MTARSAVYFGLDGTLNEEARLTCGLRLRPEATMNGLIYLVGLIVVIMFILSFLGLR